MFQEYDLWQVWLCAQVSDVWKAGDTGNAPPHHVVIITGLFGAACSPVSCNRQFQAQCTHRRCQSRLWLQSRSRGLWACEQSCLCGDRGSPVPSCCPIVHFRGLAPESSPPACSTQPPPEQGQQMKQGSARQAQFCC